MVSKQEYEIKNLMKVLVGNNIKLFEKFIEENGINCVEIKDKRNLLMYCIIQKKNDFAKKTIELGINLNHQDAIGYSALHFTVQENNLEILELLLKSKATVDIIDKNGNTPLWRAAFIQNKIDKKIIELLINAGADINKINNHGIAPKKFIENLVSGIDN